MIALASVASGNGGGSGSGDGIFPTILGDDSEVYNVNKGTMTSTRSKCSGSGSTLPLVKSSQFGTPCPSHLHIWQQLHAETGNLIDDRITCMTSARDASYL